MQNSDMASWKVPWKGIIAALGCGIFSLIMVFSKVANPREILQELENYPTSYFLLALSCVVLSWGIDALRIRALTRATGHHIEWWKLTVALAAANFLTLVTPFAGGGGALIIYVLYRRGVSAPRASAVVTAGGMAGQLSLAALSLIVFSLLDQVPPRVGKFLIYVRIAFVLYMGVLIALLYLASRSTWVRKWLQKKKIFDQEEDQSFAVKTGQWVNEFQATYKQIFSEKGRYFARSLAAAFAYYVVYYLASFTLLTGFGVSEGILRYGVSVLLGVAPVFSPIPGGAGTAELVAYLVLEQTLPKHALGTFIVLWRTVVFYIPIIIGGSIFTFLVFRWAAAKRNLSSESVILSEENDHNR